MPITHEEADGDSQGDSRGSAVRMWSIGQWEQKIPDPDTEDIYHWYTDLKFLINSIDNVFYLRSYFSCSVVSGRLKCQEKQYVPPIKRTSLTC